MSYDHNGIETIAHYTGGGIGISAEQTSLGYKYLSFGCTNAETLDTSCSLLDAPGVIRAIRLAADAFGECPEMLLRKKEPRPGGEKIILPARKETHSYLATDGTIIMEQPAEDGEASRIEFLPQDLPHIIGAMIKEAPLTRTTIVALIEQLQTLLGEVVRTDAAASSPKKPEPLAPKLHPGRQRP